MKEATLKKYNKTQLETYAKKAKDQIKKEERPKKGERKEAKRKEKSK